MIELENVSKIYKESKDNETKAIDNVSFKIEDSEMVAIIGKSGSGKTTLLNLISCLDRATSGKIYLNGEAVNLKRDKELANIRNNNIGFVFQDFNLMNNYTAYENIEIPLLIKKVHRKKRKEIITEYAKKVGIENKLENKPNELSGGEKQRVAIVRALVADAKTIIADEPTRGIR